MCYAFFISVAFATFRRKRTPMPTGYQIANQEGLYYLTLQVVQWADIFPPLSVVLSGSVTTFDNLNETLR